jgi:hypothetical protein
VSGRIVVEGYAPDTHPLEAHDASEYADMLEARALRHARAGNYDDANLLNCAAAVMRALMERCE